MRGSRRIYYYCGLLLVACGAEDEDRSCRHRSVQRVAAAYAAGDEAVRGDCGPTSRLAIYGVSDERYVSKYWTTFSSMACKEADADLYLFVVTSGDVKIPSTPPVLAGVLTYIVADLRKGNNLLLHSAWSEVAYTWAAVPELLYGVGYEHALYVDGDVVAAPHFSCSSIPMTNSAILGAAESSLGTMLGALGGGSEVFEAQRDVFGLTLEDLLWGHQILNTGVLIFSCSRAAEIRLGARFAGVVRKATGAGLLLYGDMHVLGLMTALDSALASPMLPLAWNHRFDKSVATLDKATLSFAYGHGATSDSNIQLAHFTWYKPWVDPSQWAEVDPQRLKATQWWRVCNSTLSEPDGAQAKAMLQAAREEAVLLTEVVVDAASAS